ncbi:RIC1 protein [Besnoitia besnoiti]|uniref:RIC1 protein n=1 Tax=Besnoitia besnoiti TaxID=94643 RepID=A0A2A9M5T5_BESBE|nr:RIC1 protein [Besnoitia besnoiti]XP_029215028.1 RIC1 protein [Besnoitia besnoiti]PFH31013.1 RIC1 protein [Besnoitia besnoiti]PFH31018.1 RIC1 protein [Besnoitia besnoiti]
MQGQSGKDAAQSAGATSSVRFDLQEAAKLQWANPLGLEDARGGPLEEEDGEWEHQRVQGGCSPGYLRKQGEERRHASELNVSGSTSTGSCGARSSRLSAGGIYTGRAVAAGSERESAAGGFLDVECCYALLLPIEQKPEPLLIAGVLAPLGVVVACSPSRVAVRRASLPPPTAAECAERRGRQRLRAPCINLRLQLQPSLHPLLTRLLAVSAADRSFVHAHPPLSGVAFPARRAAGPGPSVGRLSPRPASGHQSPFPSPSPVGALACGVGLRAHETAAELLFQIRASPFFTHLVELALYELFERFLSGFKRELRALAPFKASRSAQTPPANGLAQAGVAGASPQRDANGECRSGVSGVSASSTLPHQKRGSMESENVGDPTEGWAAAAGAALMRHREEGLQRREIGLQSSRFSPSACSGPCSAEQKGANRNDSGKETRQQRLPRAPSPPAKAYVLSLPQAQVSTENEEARRRRHQGGAAPQQTSRVLQRTNRGDWEDAERAREAGKEMASQRKLAASDGRELAQPGSEEAMGPRRSRDARKKDRDRDEFGKASARYEDSHGGAKQAYGIAEAERRACALFSLDRLLRAEDVSEAFSLVAPRAHPYRVPVPSQLSSGPSLSPSSGSDVPLPSSASSRSVARAGSHGALSPHPAASSPSAELSLQQRFAVAQEALTALPGGAALYLFLHLLSRHSPSTLAKTVASCVRKTEPTLAPLVLFPLLGSPPATYFEDAMKRQLLHTASIYLLVLQNTEGCLVVRQKRALPLLRAALRLGVAGLARKLVRFVLALLVAYPARKRAENSACEATGDPTESAKARQASVHALREGNCEEDIVVPWSGAGGAPALWAPPALFQERRRSRSHAARSRAEEKPAREGEQLHSQVEEEEGSRRAQKAKHGQRAEERAERQADAKADEERAIFQLYRDVVAIVEDCLLSSLVHLQWLRVFQLTSVLALDLPAWLFRLRPHICRVFSLDGPCGLLPSPESAPVVSPCCSHSQCLFLQDDPAVPFERVVLSLVSQLGLSARGFASRSIWSAAQWRACLLGSRSLPSLCRTTEMGRLHQGSLLARTSSRASSHFGVDASLAISDSAEAAPAPTACREGTDLQSEEADARVLAASPSACEWKRGSYAAVSGAWVHLPSVRGLTPSPAPASPFPPPTFREFRACTQRPHAGLHAQVSPPSSSVPLPLPDGWFTHKQVYRGRLASSFSPRTNARAGAPSPPAGLPQRLGRRVQPNFVSGSEGEYSLRAATESLTAFFLHVFVRADLPVLALALLVAAGDREGVRRILSLSPSLRLRIQMKQEESNGRVSASADTTAQQPSKAAALESGHPGGRSREDAKTAGGGAVRRKQNRDAGGWAAMSRSLRELLFVMAEQAAESGAPTGERIEPPAGRNGERIRKT